MNIQQPVPTPTERTEDQGVSQPALVQDPKQTREQTKKQTYDIEIVTETPKSRTEDQGEGVSQPALVPARGQTNERTSDVEILTETQEVCFNVVPNDYNPKAGTWS